MNTSSSRNCKERNNIPIEKLKQNLNEYNKICHKVKERKKYSERKHRNRK